MSDVIDMSYEAQFERIHAAAKELKKYTIHKLMAKAKARKGAALRYCKQYSVVAGAATNAASNRPVTIYEPKEQ